MKQAYLICPHATMYSLKLNREYVALFQSLQSSAKPCYDVSLEFAQKIQSTRRKGAKKVTTTKQAKEFNSHTCACASVHVLL